MKHLLVAAVVALALVAPGCATLESGKVNPALVQVATTVAVGEAFQYGIPAAKRAATAAQVSVLAKALHQLTLGTPPSPAALQAYLAPYIGNDPNVILVASAINSYYATLYPKLAAGNPGTLAIIGALASGVDNGVAPYLAK